MQSEAKACLRSCDRDGDRAATAPDKRSPAKGTEHESEESRNFGVSWSRPAALEHRLAWQHPQLRLKSASITGTRGDVRSGLTWQNRLVATTVDVYYSFG